MHVVMPTNVVAPDSLGGLERYVRELAAARVRLGDRVTVIAKRRAGAPPALVDDGVEVLYYDVPPKSDPLFALRYAGAVRSGTRRLLADIRGPVVVHAHFPVPALALPPGFLYTCHGLVHLELLPERANSYRLGVGLRGLAAAGMRRTERSVFRRAGTVITLSEHMRDRVLDLSGVEATVIPGGLDTNHFSPSGPVDRRVPGLIVTARRLVAGKGVRELVLAMPSILAFAPGARLVIAGEGPERASIETAVRDLGLESAVELAGQLDDEALVRLYRSADLVVTPTQQLEPFGLSTAEALACGVPVLVTPNGGSPEVVRGLPPEFVAAGASPADLAQAVARVLGSPALLGDARSRARSLVHPAMSWDAVAARHSPLYEASLS